MAEEFEVYFLEDCMAKAQSHFESKSTNGLEAMGLLVGRFFSWQGKNWVLCEDYITASNDATSVSVRFSRQGFEGLTQKFREKRKTPNSIIVGWAHSHPGYGCFLSQTDLDTQTKLFPHPQSIALVIDPLKKENNSFLKRAFRVENGQTKKISFAVIKTKPQKITGL